MPDQQIAVLIDYENVGPSAIQWVMDQVSDQGRVIVKRAYGEWTTNSGQLSQLMELGVEPVQLFHITRGGKNASDMRLVIDAIELLYQSPVDTFVILSSDSDFVPLVRKLRAAGKTVVGAGRQATVSRALVTSCDRYFYLDQRGEMEQPRQSVQEAPRRQESLLVRAVRATMDEQGKALGSRVYQTIQRLDPAFDFHALGYATLTRYLENAPEVKVTRPHGPGDIIVELAERPAIASANMPVRGRERGYVPPRRVSHGIPRPSRASVLPSGALVAPAPIAPAAGPVVPLTPAPVESFNRMMAALPGQPEQSLPWEAAVDAAWHQRAARRNGVLPGSSAAAEAAKVLGAQNLRITEFKTLEKLIQSSRLLQSRWAREGNTVVKKVGTG